MLCRSLWMLGWGESQSSEPLSSPFPAWSAPHLYLLHLPFDILSSSHQTNRQQPPQQQWQYCSWSHPEMGPDFTLIPQDSYSETLPAPNPTRGEPTSGYPYLFTEHHRKPQKFPVADWSPLLPRGICWSYPHWAGRSQALAALWLRHSSS